MRRTADSSLSKDYRLISAGGLVFCCEQRMWRPAGTAIKVTDVTWIVGLDVADGAPDRASTYNARIRDDLVSVGSLKDGFRGHKSRIAKNRRVRACFG